MQTYQQLNAKNKVSKQEEQRQSHGYRVCFDGCQMGEEVRGLRSTNKKWSSQRTYMYGHEQCWGDF